MNQIRTKAKGRLGKRCAAGSSTEERQAEGLPRTRRSATHSQRASQMRSGEAVAAVRRDAAVLAHPAPLAGSEVGLGMFSILLVMPIPHHPGLFRLHLAHTWLPPIRSPYVHPFSGGPMPRPSYRIRSSVPDNTFVEFLATFFPTTAFLGRKIIQYLSTSITTKNEVQIKKLSTHS